MLVLGPATLLQGQPCPLEKGDVFHFGASTRTYSIQVPVTADTGSGKAGSKKRPRVTFAGDDDVDADTTPGSHDHGKRRSLEQVWLLRVLLSDCRMQQRMQPPLLRDAAALAATTCSV